MKHVARLMQLWHEIESCKSQVQPLIDEYHSVACELARLLDRDPIDCIGIPLGSKLRSISVTRCKWVMLDVIVNPITKNDNNRITELLDLINVLYRKILIKLCDGKRTVTLRDLVTLPELKVAMELNTEPLRMYDHVITQKVFAGGIYSNYIHSIIMAMVRQQVWYNTIHKDAVGKSITSATYCIFGSPTTGNQIMVAAPRNIGRFTIDPMHSRGHRVYSTTTGNTGIQLTKRTVDINTKHDVELHTRAARNDFILMATIEITKS